MSRRSLLPPSSKNARRVSHALSRETAKYPERKIAKRRRKVKAGAEITLVLAAAFAFGAYCIYALRKGPG